MPYITSQQFQSEISKGVFAPVYIFAGEEVFDHDEALKDLEKALSVDSMNREVFFGNESKTQEIIMGAQTLPFLGEKRLIIVKNANKIRANDADKFSEFLKFPVDSTCLVLLWVERLAKDTKKKAIFGAVERSGNIVEFKRRYDNELPAWVRERVSSFGKKIGFEASQMLLQESGSSLLDLSNEIEKLVISTGKSSEITVEDVESVSGRTKTASLNRLAEMLETKDLESSLKIIEDLLREGEEPIKILFRIYWVLRRLLIAKSMALEEKTEAAEIRQALRLHNYFDRSFFLNLKKFSLKELLETPRLVMKADLELKTSARPASMVLDELIFSLCAERVYKA